MNSKVVIVLGKCSQTQRVFGIRFEERSPVESNRIKSLLFKTNNGISWSGTRAFPIKEDSANREGYNKEQIKGYFIFDIDYPGCPHCKGKSIVKCSCGKVGCWDGASSFFRCPWCGYAGELSGQIETLDAGADH